MERHGKWMTLMLAMLSAVLAGTWGLSQVASQEANRGESVRPAFSQALPRMDSGHLELKGVEVSYAPGASSTAHSHPCPVIAYVTEGTVRSQVNDGPETIYKTGEAFYEALNGVHRVSANASQTEPAKLLAIFACDHETPVTVAVPEGKGTGRK
jgi:quercetin dioxygenase-like cupin family protein